MNRAILIELVTYTPILCSYLNNNEKETIEQQIGLSAIQLIRWERGEDLSVLDIVKQACADKNDWVVYSLHEQTNYTSNEISEVAAQYNRKKLVDYCIDEGADNWNWIAFNAIRGHHLPMVKYIIEKGNVSTWNWLALSARVHKQPHITDYLVDRGAKGNWKTLPSDI